MKSSDIALTGLRNLTRRKVRTLLTLVGVVIGTAAIVIMISLGIGMNESINYTISQLGDLTVIDLYKWSGSRDDKGNYISVENALDDALLEKLKKMDGVLAVSPFLDLYEAKVYAGNTYEMQWASIVGVYPEMLEYLDVKVSAGLMPKKGDKFILFGAERIYDFINPRKPIRDWYKEFYNEDGTRKPPKVDVLQEKIAVNLNPEYIYINGKPIDVKKLQKHEPEKVGVMQQSEKNWETVYTIYMDFETVREMKEEYAKLRKYEDPSLGSYERIRVKTKDIKSTEKVQEKLQEMGIATYGLSDYRQEMQKSQATLRLILGGIGIISLLVATIGIANTMIMAIYERTREIGIMKVLGCSLRSIKNMFLFEATLIGLFGGIIGIGFSYLGSYLMNRFLNTSGGIMGNPDYGYMTPEGVAPDISIIPTWLILAAVILATFVGLVAGYLPAKRATKISALEAIKTE